MSTKSTRGKTGYKISADLPGDNGDGGSITIEQNDVDVDPKSLLRVTQNFPPKFENIMVLDFTMTIEQPGNGNGGEPLVLTTKDPAKLIGTITQYPPKGDLYQLQIRSIWSTWRTLTPRSRPSRSSRSRSAASEQHCPGDPAGLRPRFQRGDRGRVTVAGSEDNGGSHP
ncbi:hypothetical protein [Streptomyces mirabilis]|uniref:hypothetical protein n=1 Tax=Streptomyces mirabilis TaxID=68239 RepID=UPI003711F3CF